MENILIVLLVLGALFFVFGSKHSRGKKYQPHQDILYQPVKPRLFEAESAKPLPSKPVVRGSAYVVDGDTLVIQKTQIRLFGVDAPEINHPYGEKAKWALISLCKGQVVRAEVAEQDAHGRTVAQCYLVFAA